MTAMTFLMITWLHVQTLGKNKKNTKIGEFSCKTNFLNMEFFLFGFKYRKKESICHEEPDFPLFLLTLQLSSVASKISLNLLPTGGLELLRCVSKGLARRQPSNAVSPQLWTRRYVHSFIERKKEKNPLRPDFASLITFLHWKSHVQKREQKLLNLNLRVEHWARFEHYQDWEIPSYQKGCIQGKWSNIF